MITIENVSQVYETTSAGRVEALRGVELEVPDAEIVCLVGPSGCGKSTLLRILAGFLESSEGAIRVDGRRVRGADPERGVVFQQPTLLPWYSVRDNVRLAYRYSGSETQKADADELIELVGLADAADRLPHELSGGMQQRTQIARVLAAGPRYVFMDGALRRARSFHPGAAPGGTVAGVGTVPSDDRLCHSQCGGSARPGSSPDPSRGGRCFT